MNNTICVKHLSKSYGALQAVKNLSFSVSSGSVFGLLGANGAGKSTAIECILGTKPYDKGTVHILGFDPITERQQLFQEVGVQFQEASYQDGILVRELCELTASLYKSPANYHDLLSQFDLMDKKNVLVKELSGGQKQRLFILLALIPKPQVVFLDELTTGLDPRARREIWQLLNYLKDQGLTILLTSHFMDEVKELCDEICILVKGTAIFQGTVHQAIQMSPYDTFEEAYLWYTNEEVDRHESI